MNYLVPCAGIFQYPHFLPPKAGSFLDEQGRLRRQASNLQLTFRYAGLTVRYVYQFHHDGMWSYIVLVYVAGFEPAASQFQAGVSTRLTYT